MEKKIFIKTFGCQMNEYDSNRIYDSVKKIGYQKTNDQNNTDCYVLNTCHIRDKAKEKVYDEVGRVKKLYRNKNKPLIIVAGCVAQAENQEMLKREPFIDAIIGPQSYHKFNDILKNHVSKEKQEETQFDTITKFEYFDEIKNKSNKVSAFLTIQEGCDKFCHFCVVPYTRGPEYSRPFEQIIKEAEELIKNGAKEITLLGQNVNAYSYKKNLKEFRISDLIHHLNKYNELERIRYTTSHPKDMTDDLIECYSSCKKLMPFVHLPIQSGSDKILKLMNRKHTVEDYLNIYNKLKKINQQIEFSSDFIIGYPGETEKDFEETLKLVEEIKFTQSYSFIYSERPGTKAASEEDEISIKVKKERLSVLQEKLKDIQLEYNKSFYDKSVKVLVENQSISNPRYFFGRTPFMQSVYLESDKVKIGEEMDVKITSCNHKSLYGIA